MDIGQKLKDTRAKAGLTQETVAETIGVSRQTVSNWENNRSYPDIASILRLSDLYAVSLDELLKEDANMRKHVEESANLLKTVWDLFYDCSVILLPIATLFSHYGWETATLVTYIMSAVLFIVPRLLYPKLFGGSWKTELMRIGAYLLMFTDIAIPLPSGNLFGTAGLVLIYFVFHEDKKNGVLRKSNWVAATLIVAVPLFIFISEADFRGEDNAYAPYPHTYRVAEVLYPGEAAPEVPIVYLDAYSGLYLRDPWTGDSDNLGTMTAVDLPQGDPATTPKGIWQLIPEDDPSMLYKITVEADESVILSCQKSDILQWKYRLSRVDTLNIGFRTRTAVGGFTARWFYEGCFHNHQNLENIEAAGTTGIGLNPESPEAVLTVFEEYYTDGTAEYAELNLPLTDSKNFSLEVSKRYDAGQQYAIYRIPYEGGEYVFRVDYS